MSPRAQSFVIGVAVGVALYYAYQQAQSNRAQ